MPQNMPTLTLQNLIQLGAHRGNSRRIRMLTLSTTLRLAGTLLTFRVELFWIILALALLMGGSFHRVRVMCTLPCTHRRHQVINTSTLPR